MEDEQTKARNQRVFIHEAASRHPDRYIRIEAGTNIKQSTTAA